MAQNEELTTVKLQLKPEQAERLRVAAARKSKRGGRPNSSVVVGELIEEHLPRLEPIGAR